MGLGHRMDLGLRMEQDLRKELARRYSHMELVAAAVAMELERHMVEVAEVDNTPLTQNFKRKKDTSMVRKKVDKSERRQESL